jgi:hypothetical protein
MRSVDLQPCLHEERPPTKADDYLAWWTPAFPYWERANSYDGFSDDAGSRHSKFGYAEVLAYADVPWLPLPEVLQRYPEVNAAVEGVQRKTWCAQAKVELRPSNDAIRCSRLPGERSVPDMMSGPSAK